MPYRQIASARIRQARPAVAAWPQLRCDFGSAVNFDGHFVTSESGCADEAVALLAHVDDDLAALAERVGHRARVGDGHRPAPLRSSHPERVDVPRRARMSPAATLPVSL